MFLFGAKMLTSSLGSKTQDTMVSTSTIAGPVAAIPAEAVCVVSCLLDLGRIDGECGKISHAWPLLPACLSLVYPEKDHFPNGMKKVVDYAHRCVRCWQWDVEADGSAFHRPDTDPAMNKKVVLNFHLNHILWIACFLAICVVVSQQGS